MTPRETLLAATEKLEQLVAEATPGPWIHVDSPTGIRGGGTYEWIRTSQPEGWRPVAEATNHGRYREHDAELIATMNPLVAAGLAELFREVAGFLDWIQEGIPMDEVPLGPTRNKVVALAQLVLGGE